MKRNKSVQSEIVPPGRVKACSMLSFDRRESRTREGRHGHFHRVFDCSGNRSWLIWPLLLHMSGETCTGRNRKQSKITYHHSALHPPRITHAVDPQKAWSLPTDRESNRREDNARLICFPSRISSLRDCD